MRARVAEARANAHNLEDFVGDAYRAYFAFIVEDPPTFELTRRNAGTIRTLFDEAQLRSLAPLWKAKKKQESPSSG